MNYLFCTQFGCYETPKVKNYCIPHASDKFTKKYIIIFLDAKEIEYKKSWSKKRLLKLLGGS